MLQLQLLLVGNLSIDLCIKLLALLARCAKDPEGECVVTRGWL